MRQQGGAKVSAETGSFPPQNLQHAPVTQRVEMDKVTGRGGSGVPAERYDDGGAVCDQVREMFVR